MARAVEIHTAASRLHGVNRTEKAAVRMDTHKSQRVHRACFAERCSAMSVHGLQGSEGQGGARRKKYRFGHEETLGAENYCPCEIISPSLTSHHWNSSLFARMTAREGVRQRRMGGGPELDLGGLPALVVLDGNLALVDLVEGDIDPCTAWCTGGFLLEWQLCIPRWGECGGAC